MSKPPVSSSARFAAEAVPAASLTNAGITMGKIKRGPNSRALVALSHLSGLLCRAPESRQRSTIRRLAQLLECPLANLTNPLPRHSKQRSDLLERHRFRILAKPVIQVENLPLARREILLEGPVDRLAHELEVGHLLDLATVNSRKALAQRRCLTIAAVDWRVQRDFRRRHLARCTNGVRRLLQQPAKLAVCRIALENLSEHRLGARQLDEL